MRLHRLTLLALAACAPADPTALPSEHVGPPGALDLWVEPLVRNQPTRFTITQATPGQTVWVGFSVTGTGTTCLRGTCLGLDAPSAVGRATAGPDGVAVVHATVPAGIPYDEVTFQAFSFGPSAVSPTRVYDITDPGEDHATLTSGVSQIDFGGALPSHLVSFLDRAMPLVADPATGRAVYAASRVNEGKVLLEGHGGLVGSDLDTRGGDADELVRNAIQWMGGASPLVGVEPGMNDTYAWLSRHGYRVRWATAAQIDPVDVWFANGGTDRSPLEDASIRAWVANGGGLILGAQAWYWGYSNEDAATNFPANHLLTDAGLVITEAYSRTGVWTVSSTPVSELDHASRALDVVTKHVQGTAPRSTADLARAVEAVGLALTTIPLSWSAYWDRVDAVAALIGPVVPTSGNPVVRATEPLDHLSLRIHDAWAMGLPADEMTVHPAASDFPGAPAAGAPRVALSVTLDGDYAGRDGRFVYSGAGAPVWRTTGAWAAPGEAIEVTVPPGAAGQGLSVQIGAHTDDLWGLASWSRAPRVTRAWPLDDTTTTVASAFGGPVYIRVPGGTSLGPVDVTLSNVVQAPVFTRGQTSLATWQATERFLPAPWAELVTESFILTVPSDQVRGVQDPGALMDFWQDVLDDEADLAGISRDRVRAERAVVDRQISAGWMHSGYPFMAHLASAPEFLTLSTLSTVGSWGAFHELGHNHQWRETILPGTTEATCNLFSLYVMETVVGLAPRTGHPAMTISERQARIDGYLARGADFWGEWSVWTALETYVQLQEAFGWDFLTDVLATYLADAPGAIPDTDQARIDAWALRSSQVAGVDLTPVYQTWGWPVSPSIAAQTALLPPFVGDAVTAE